jgi:hypothetical protein
MSSFRVLTAERPGQTKMKLLACSVETATL